jgi:hypothetical protein
MSEPISQGWINTEQAEALTGYASAYLRRLANQGRVEARKVGRDWLINQESLLAYKQEMDSLGGQRHNPWRGDLAQQGRGRNQSTNEPNQGGN